MEPRFWLSVSLLTALRRLPGGPPTGFVVLGLLIIAAQIPWSLLIILAGMKMMRVENYGLALAGAWLALLPLSLASIITMPLGIWAIVVLSSRDTREAFRKNANR